MPRPSAASSRYKVVLRLAGIGRKRPDEIGYDAGGQHGERQCEREPSSGNTVMTPIIGVPKFRLAS